MAKQTLNNDLGDDGPSIGAALSPTLLCETQEDADDYYAQLFAYVRKELAPPGKTDEDVADFVRHEIGCWAARYGTAEEQRRTCELFKCEIPKIIKVTFEGEGVAVRHWAALHGTVEEQRRACELFKGEIPKIINVVFEGEYVVFNEFIPHEDDPQAS